MRPSIGDETPGLANSYYEACANPYGYIKTCLLAVPSFRARILLVIQPVDVDRLLVALVRFDFSSWGWPTKDNMALSSIINGPFR